MAARGFRRILIAVRDVTSVSSVMLEKAATLARASGARVELFHALNEPIALEMMQGRTTRVSLEQAGARAAELAQRRLTRIAASRRFARLEVSCHVEWDFPPHEAVIRRALTRRCDLIIAQTQPQGFAARFLLANTDWELIRHSPIPVLLVKSRANYRRATILAAVDPFHARAKPAALDARIAEATSLLARLLGGEAHLIHAYIPATTLVPTVPPLAVDVSPEMLQIEESRIRSALERLGTKAGIPVSRRHVTVGDTASELEECVRRNKARIIVMGAVSRSRLKRFFIGSTAERLLDRLSCDVLIVKPREFRSSVPRRIARRTGVHRTRA
jgi:universal stress protein E